MTLRTVVLAPSVSNRATDLGFALTVAGTSCEVLTFDELAQSPERLRRVQLVAVAGDTFATPSSHNATPSTHAVADTLRTFVARGSPVIGVGGGFPLLTTMGLLPGTVSRHSNARPLCHWVELEAPATRCVWTQELAPIRCPITLADRWYEHDDIEALADNGQVALRYRYNLDHDAVGSIAGVCDPTGVVLGLVPQPELHVLARQHPQHRMPAHQPGKGLALAIFERGIHYATNR